MYPRGNIPNLPIHNSSFELIFYGKLHLWGEWSVVLDSITLTCCVVYYTALVVLLCVDALRPAGIRPFLDF